MYTYKNKTYKSQLEIAREFGINRSTLNKRLLKGIPLDKAIKSDTFKPGDEVIYNGKKYPSTNKLALELNIKSEYLYSRLKKGMSIEESVNEVFSLIDAGKLKLGRGITNKVSNEFIIWNESFVTIDAVENKYKLCKNTLSESMSRKEMQKIIIDNKEKEVSSMYKELKTVAKLSRHYNIQPSRVHQRLKKGWNITEAIIVPARKRHGKTIEYKGVEYAGKGELSSYYGIDSIHIDSLSKLHSIPWVQMFELVERFLSKNGLNDLNTRPKIIGKMYIIYNGTWFESASELSKETNISERSLSVNSNVLSYLEEILGKSNGFCFNYRYELNNFIDEFKKSH